MRTLTLALLWALPAVAHAGDPRLLFAEGQAKLRAGDRAGARQAFQAAYQSEEVNTYTSFAGKPEQAALLEERMGDPAAASKAWDLALEKNPARALLFASLYTDGEERGRLVASAVDRLRRLAQELEEGNEVTLFVNSKGERKQVSPLDPRKALASLKRGDAVSYVYLPVLDLRGLTFDKPLSLRRCIIGSILATGATLPDLDLSDSVILGEAHFGKGWEGEVHRSRTLPPARMQSIQAFGATFLGAVSFEGVPFEGRLQNFPFALFLAGADFRSASFGGTTDLRYASFDGPAQFRGARFTGPTYLGFARFEKGLSFERTRVGRSRLFLNSARIVGSRFDQADLPQGATFEDADLLGPAILDRVQARGPITFARARIEAPLSIVQSDLEDLDLIGAEASAPVAVETTRVRGDLRFSLPQATRRRLGADPTGLEAVYKLYRGDEDAEEEPNAGPRYGVRGPDDLTARLTTLSLSGSAVDGSVVLERVAVTGDADLSSLRAGTAVQMAEAEFDARLDLRSLSAREVSMSATHLRGSVMLDDAAVPGRVTLTDAELAGDLSLYGASLGALVVDRDQVEGHLFHGRCAARPSRALGDPRLAGIGDVSGTCYARVVDELSQLKNAFASQAQPADADWAYFEMRHHKNLALLVSASSSVGQRAGAALSWLFFEKAFGWGVHLTNILFTAVALAFFFALLYRVFCPDSRLTWDGEDRPLREVPFHGLLILSAQSLMAMNIGWDGERTDRAFKNLNTAETLVGLILLTFFVGAYTRMVLS